MQIAQFCNLTTCGRSSSSGDKWESPGMRPITTIRTWKYIVSSKIKFNLNFHTIQHIKYNYTQAVSSLTKKLIHIYA